MKEQIEMLKKVYYQYDTGRMDVRLSLYIICLDNTMMVLRQINEVFDVKIHTSYTSRAYALLANNQEFRKFHEKNVEKLKQIGFRFV